MAVAPSVCVRHVAGASIRRGLGSGAGRHMSMVRRVQARRLT